MHPCDIQKQSGTSRARSIHPIMISKDVSDDVFPRNSVKRHAVEKPTAAICADCQVARERDELIRSIVGLHEAADKRLASLTDRQHEILQKVLNGQPSKNIAADLHISQRTVENHRQSIMKRTGARSLPELARLALTADWTRPTGPVPEGVVAGS